MFLSEVLKKYLVTSVSEGTNIVKYSFHPSEKEPSIVCLEYTDENGQTYCSEFDDQYVTWTGNGNFVVSCDGYPQEFTSWVPYGSE